MVAFLRTIELLFETEAANLASDVLMQMTYGFGKSSNRLPNMDSCRIDKVPGCNAQSLRCDVP